MEPNTEGPFRLYYEVLRTGEPKEKGFPTNESRYDWTMNTKGIRVIGFEPETLTPPPTISDSDLADAISCSSTGRKLLDEFVDAQPDDGTLGPIHYREVGVWVREHMDDLNLEGNRREQSIPEL